MSRNVRLVWQVAPDQGQNRTGRWQDELSGRQNLLSQKDLGNLDFRDQPHAPAERGGPERPVQPARRERQKNAPTWTRTKNLLIKSQLLYQLSYRGEKSILALFFRRNLTFCSHRPEPHNVHIFP